MSIQSKQIGAIANNVINTFLQNGVVPNVNTVISAVYGELMGRPPGTPLTSYTPVAPDTITDPASLNALVQTIQVDLQNLYNENIDLVNRVVRDFDYKETRRERLIQRIIEITGLLSVAEASQNLTYAGMLGSFQDIDFTASTAFINFRDYTVELPPASNQTLKIPLTSATATWKSSGAVLTTLGNIENILSDLLNKTFITRIGSNTQQAQLEVTITLPQPELVSNLTLTTHIGSPITALVTLDTETLPTQVVDVTRRVTWEISERYVSNINIVLKKSTPDGITGTQNYFDFGLRNISLLSQHYIPKALFQTAPLNFPSGVSSLTLATDQLVPPNCQIQWGISTNGSSGPFSPLVPGKTLTFASDTSLDYKRIYPVRSTRALSSIYKTDALGNITSSADGGLPVLAAIRGSRTPLFNLARINPAANATVLMRGRNAWRVLSYHYDISQIGAAADKQPSLLDFASPRNLQAKVYSRYQPTEFDLNNQFPGLSSDLSSALRLPALEYPFQSQNDRVMHLFEANLTVDPTLAPSVLAGLAATVVVLPNFVANGRATIYCNGGALTVSAGTTALGSNALQYSVTLPLQPGPNLLQIVTNNYTDLGGAPFNIGTTLFNTLCVPGGQVKWYADPGPMTSVSLFELQYQTDRNDFSRYAITSDPTSASNVIVVRELPTTVYDLSSTGVALNSPTSLVLQAALKGSSVSPSLTPKINGYSLNITS